MLLATGMFFFQDTYFSIGGIELSLKNPCALAILFLALLNFTVTVRLDRLLILSRHTAVQMLPCLVPLVFSSIVWVGTRAESIAVLNGVSMVIPQLLAVLAAAATLYLFGGKGIWYCLGAMCMANLAGMLVVIYEGGLDAFLREFSALVVTFSAETGPLMMQLETHDLTFAFGPFLIYLLLHWKTAPHPLLWLVLSSLFFLIGLKRIAFPAVALGVFVAFLLGLLPEKAARQTAICVAGAMMVISFLYIAGIHDGLFEYLERAGLDTKSRALLFGNVTPYYDVSFTYMGRGTGFERFVEWFTGVESSVPLRTQTQIHNDFLRMYLNIGFIGYWVWLWSWLMVRLRYWFRQGGKDAGCLFLGVCVYCFVLYATDNTIYYPYTMLACSLVPMTCRLDALAEETLETYCVHWSGGEEVSLSESK
jgi:hypothetical protein